jgi:hypothetical protein
MVILTPETHGVVGIKAGPYPGVVLAGLGIVVAGVIVLTGDPND